jgi:hypothetical protein
MPFSEDDAVEIASASKEAQDFEKKHPECVWNVDKMKPKDTDAWIKKHPNVTVTTKATPLKGLWLVELEELDQEKLVIIISPDTKTVVDVKTEKLEAEAEEEEEEEAEEEGE